MGMNEIGMAIIGAGTWGTTHAAIYNEYPAVRLAGVCDANRERALALAEKYGIDREHVYTDHREMIRRCPFDAVAVVTPDFLHRDFAVDCALAGKHLLIEKPLATTRRDVEDVMNAVARTGVRMMVDLHNRFNPPFAIAKASLDAGEIGQPYNAYFRLNDAKWVATDMLSWAAESSILWFLGSHSVDTLRWFFSDEVETVYAVSRKGILSGLGVDTDDIFQTILTFRNGGIATMENGWITPNAHPCVNDIKFNITGTKGMFNLDLSNNQMIERFTDVKSDRPDVLVNHFVHGRAMGFAYQSIRHFVDRLLDGKPFLVTPEDAANTSLVILAILESAKKREPVKVSYM
jgi:predicted dehydrogenase